MQTTSKEWKANQALQLTSEGFVEVSYKVSDPDIWEKGPAVDADEKLYLSEPEKLISENDYEITPYATCEPDLWRLDGSRITVPGSGGYGYSGYISRSLCDENGQFAPPLVVVIEFDEMVTSMLPGLTVTWGTAYNEYPVEFRVKVLDGGSYVAGETVINNGVVSIVELEMTNFDRIEIEIVRWCRGRRRARLGKIFMGIEKVYTKSDMLKFSSSETVDPVSAALPKYEVSFEIDNRDDMFNPLNDAGLSKYMMERQEIRTRYGYSLNGLVEWIPGGVYYLSDWSAPQNGLSALFKARDLLGFLNKTYYKGTYEPGGVTLYTLAQKVLREANSLKEDPWVLDEEALGGVTTTAPLPVSSLAKCLQLIANAACCVIFFDRSGRLHIEPPASTEDSVQADDDKSYSKAEISLTDPVMQIDVSMYSYAEEPGKELYNGNLTLHPGENVFEIEYSNTARDVIVQVSAGSVSVVPAKTNFYAKFCTLVLDCPSSVTCNVIITGTVLKPGETIISVNSPDGTFQTGRQNDEPQVLKNNLITNEACARAVGGWVYGNLRNRKRASLSWRADPGLETLDTVKIVRSGEEEPIDLLVTSSELEFTGAFKEKIEGTVMS